MNTTNCSSRYSLESNDDYIENLQKEYNSYLNLIQNLYESQKDSTYEIDMTNQEQIKEAQKKLVANISIYLENYIPQATKTKHHALLQFQILNNMWKKQQDSLMCIRMLDEQIKKQMGLIKELEEELVILKNNEISNEEEEEEEDTQPKYLKEEFQKQKFSMDYLLNFFNEDTRTFFSDLITASDKRNSDGYFQLPGNVDNSLLNSLIKDSIIQRHPTDKTKIKFIIE